MKKLLLFLVSSILVMSMAACGSEEKNNTETGEFLIEQTASKDTDAEQEQSAPAKTDMSQIVNSNVGDIVTFGKYTWKVLAKENNKALIISENSVARRPYHENSFDMHVTWETCDLRQWLNNDFYNEFSDGEKAQIATTLVVTEDNPKDGTEGGNNTEDKIFILSAEEAEQYFSSDEERKATFTGTSYGYSYDHVPDAWRLRSPQKFCSRLVGKLGDIDGNWSVDLDEMGIRPVMWINLD